MRPKVWLQGHTKNSITRMRDLERELSKVSQYGHANDNEELELGVRCMAAGIYDDQDTAGSRAFHFSAIRPPGRPLAAQTKGNCAADFSVIRA
jgi:hypothetical protein